MVRELEAISTELTSPTDIEIAQKIIDSGFKNVVLTSCSVYQGIEAALRESKRIRMIKLPHEHGLAGFAGGLILGGEKSMVMAQNSAFFNVGDGFDTFAKPAVNNLSILFLMSWRRDRESEPHFETGKITDPLTRLIFEDAVFGNEDGSNFLEEFERANEMVEKGRMAVLRMPQEAFVTSYRALLPVQDTIFDRKKYSDIKKREKEFSRQKGTFRASNPFRNLNKGKHVLGKEEAISRVHEFYTSIDPETRFVVGNGFNSRTALKLFNDNPNFLLVPGYMGGAGSVGLGLALARPDVPIVVIMGNENLDMAMSSISKFLKTEYPSNSQIVTLHDKVGASVGGAPSTEDTSDMYDYTRTIAVRPEVYDLFVRDNPRVTESAKKTKRFQQALARVARRTAI